MVSKGSFHNDLLYSNERVATAVILDSVFTKELRILMREGQSMREHKSKFPIVVHVLSGSIDFSVEGETHRLDEGAIIGLDGDVTHSLLAIEDSAIRLTLSKSDKAERVENVVSAP